MRDLSGFKPIGWIGPGPHGPVWHPWREQPAGQAVYPPRCTGCLQYPLDCCGTCLCRMQAHHPECPGDPED